MRSKFIEHILSIILVSGILLGLLLFVQGSKGKADRSINDQVRELSALPFVNGSRPFDRALLSDVLDIYYPGQHDMNAATVSAVEQYQTQTLNRSLQESHLKEGLTTEKILQLLGMYSKFVIVYLLVLFLTYYGVQTVGTWRFIQKKRRAARNPETGTSTIGQRFKTVASAIGKITGSFILFCPAYVIAYSIRTEFGTDTIPFMILLAVISNGLLMMYSNKFYTFLMTENRKGYIETALVKNLNASYDPHDADGIRYAAIFSVRKKFPGHLFNHLFRNAQLQYLSSIKEQATFLITGLIIIEMALNIHGCLNYEMLRQILYKNYDIVIAIIIGIFFTVKATEIGVDLLMAHEAKKYENK